MASKKPRRVERVVTTACIQTAFDAAMHLFEEWVGPEGPAVVRDVYCKGNEYDIVYRLIAAWGKEAW